MCVCVFNLYILDSGKQAKEIADISSTTVTALT